MKNSLKKKFLDILFENDEDYGKKKHKKTANTSFDEPYKSKKVVKNSEVKAKDVLYHKSGTSAFIDLDEKPRQETTGDKPKKDYEFTSQISPIFGMVNEKRKSFNESKAIDDSLINKPENSHLDIITSPIYGYGPQDESNYRPSETNFLPFDEEEYSYSENEEVNNLMDYVDNREKDEEELYEELREEETEHEEYMGYYQSDYPFNEEIETVDEHREIPYYDSDVLNDDVEEISLFDVDEDE